MSRRSLRMVLGALGVTIPWLLIWGTTIAGPGVVPPVLELLSVLAVVLISGLAILGAAFLLAWAAETAEKDVPRSFAIAVLAVLAVAPEYAVDALYAWDAGMFAGTPRGTEAGNLAVANMTGANRILIGLGWAGIAIFTVVRHSGHGSDAVDTRPGFWTDAVRIHRDLGLEIVFLLLATAWAFLVPLNGGIDFWDMVVLVGLYVAYIIIVLRGKVEPPTGHIGVPAYLQSFSKRRRVATVILLFAYSGFLILTAVEPFAHGLEDIGENIGVPSFFMIQWVAPLASESPELIVVLYLVNKARTTAGFNALISSKLNQWTLLIGTLVVVYSIALGRYGVLTFDPKQAAEIWLTAAQSFFAIAVLVNFEISIREAVVLLVLFVSQVVLEFLMIREVLQLPITDVELLLVFMAIYLVLGTILFVNRRHAFVALVRRTTGTVRRAISPEREQDASSHGD